MPKKEGKVTKWWYGVIRRHTQTPVESVAFTWNEWTSEERKELLDNEFPDKSMTNDWKNWIKKSVNKQWDEFNLAEQDTIYHIYSKWIKKQPVE